jgi:hypothetical protein
VLRTVFGSKTQEITRSWRKLCIEKLLGLYALQTVIRRRRLGGSDGTDMQHAWVSPPREPQAFVKFRGSLQEPTNGAYPFSSEFIPHTFLTNILILSSDLCFCKVKVKFTLAPAMKAHRDRGIDLHFL